jgi:hypothetical protein
MLYCDAARFVLLMGLALAVWLDHVGIFVILCVTVIEAALTVLFGSVEMPAIRNVVAKDQLSTAMARNEARSSATDLFGPPLGGLLYTFGRAVPFFSDAASYALSFLGVLAIRSPLRQSQTSHKQSPYRDLIEGVRFAFERKFIRSVLMIAIPLNFCITGALFAIILVLRQQGTSAAIIGLVDTIAAIGGLVGAICTPWLQKKLSMSALIRSISLGGLFLFASTVALTGSILIAVPISVMIFLVPALNATVFGHLAATTPDGILGRVGSVVNMGTMSVAALAPTFAGTMVHNFSAPITMLSFTAVLALSTLAAFMSSGMRALPKRDLARKDENDEPVSAAG